MAIDTSSISLGYFGYKMASNEETRYTALKKAVSAHGLVKVLNRLEQVCVNAHYTSQTQKDMVYIVSEQPIPVEETDALYNENFERLDISRSDQQKYNDYEEEEVEEVEDEIPTQKYKEYGEEEEEEEEIPEPEMKYNDSDHDTDDTIKSIKSIKCMVDAGIDCRDFKESKTASAIECLKSINDKLNSAVIDRDYEMINLMVCSMNNVILSTKV